MRVRFRLPPRYVILISQREINAWDDGVEVPKDVFFGSHKWATPHPSSSLGVKEVDDLSPLDSPTRTIVYARKRDHYTPKPIMVDVDKNLLRKRCRVSIPAGSTG